MGFGFNLDLNSLVGLFTRDSDHKRQYKENRRLETYNRQMAEEEFKRNQGETDRLFDRDKAYAEQIWGRDVAKAEELWQKQNERNDMMWHRQNEYNSPAMQMERMKEAGLNPKLMYQQGTTGNTGIVTSSPIKTQSGSTPSSQRATMKHREGYKRDIYSANEKRFAMFAQAINLGLSAKNMMMKNKYLEERTKQEKEVVQRMKRENKMMKGVSEKDHWMYRLFHRLFSSPRGDYTGGRMIDLEARQDMYKFHNALEGMGPRTIKIDMEE